MIRNANPLLAACLLLLLATPVGAVSTAHYSSGAVFTGVGGPQLFREIASAEGRFGNNASNGSHELSIGAPGTHPSRDDRAGYTWVPGAAEAFRLAYDSTVGVLTFSVGTVELDMVTRQGFDEIYVRAYAGPAGSSSLMLDNLVLNGVTVGDRAYAYAGSTDVLRISGGVFDRAGDFELSGQAVMNWLGRAHKDDLAFQFKLGNQTRFGPQTVVPLPPASLLFLSAIGAIAAIRRRPAA